MATVAQWIEGARPRTLPASGAPVIVGSGAAFQLGHFEPLRALLALAVALLLQIGVNYANDYSDGIRGTDRERVGPVRLVGQGLAAPKRVKLAAYLSFAAAAIAGLVLAALAGWWLILVGAAAIVAAWFYTGGSTPYGYLGFGELFVFVFFGLVATVGTEFVQAGTVNDAGLAGAVGIGMLITAILVVNNLRDIPGDRSAAKLTLAVRIGDRKTRALYSVLVVAGIVALAAAVGETPWALLLLLPAATSVPLLRAMIRGDSGRDLIKVLAGTGRLALIASAVTAFGLIR